MNNTEESDINNDEKSDSSKNTPKINWTTQHEYILIDWGDKAMCYRWLHSKSNEYYSFQNTWFTIPVIIMSTITGTANFAQDQFPESIRGYAPMLIGSVNIFAGIITTIQQFLKITELNEAHRVSSISWDKFYRKIKVELAKSPEERQSVIDFIKLCTEEYDRLTETSPTIDQKIINKFLNTFEGKELSMGFCAQICNYITNYAKSSENKIVNNEKLNEKYNMFKEIKKPVICDTMESLKNSVYKPPVNKLLEKKNHTIIDIVKEKQEFNQKEKIILDFKKKFMAEYHREPTEQEVMDNLINEEKNISLDVIKNMVHKWKVKKENLSNNIEMKIVKQSDIDNSV